MPYGLIYFANFNTISAEPLNYRLNIYKKDYDGATSEITLTANACIQEWQDDNPMEPIKGCTLNVGILNDGTISLEDFYSEADDEFYLEFIRVDTEQCLFRGYILQDDCQEIVVEYAHEINIVATDNLGTLKGVTLNEAAQNLGTPVTETNISISAGVYGGSFNTTDPKVSGLQPGQKFTIAGTTLYNGTFTCNLLEYDYINNVYKIYTTPAYNGSILDPAENADITFITPLDILGYVSLLTLVRLCLKSTNIDCGLNVISQLYLQDATTERWLDSTFIKGGTFQNNESWDDCYVVLEKIMRRFNATCFQSKGEWYIVRWGEYFNRKQAGTDPAFSLIGYVYDNTFTNTGLYYGNDLFSINENDIATGLIKSIVRPYKFLNETFNYNQQSSLIPNTDFQDLGNLRTTFVSGSNTISDYDLKYYTSLANPPSSDAYFRITKDADNKEIGRALIIYDYSPFNQARMVKSEALEINKGSKIKFSFDFRTSISIPGPTYREYFLIVYFDGTNENYLRDDLTFYGSSPIVQSFVDAGDNFNQWHTFEKEFVIPDDGKFYFYFPQLDSTIGNQSQYQNIQITTTGVYIGNKTIIGHTHNQTQTATIKNSLSTELSMDIAPSGIIRGALFTDQIVNGIQQLGNKVIIKSGLPFTIPVTLSVDPEIPNVIYYNGCNLELVVEEYITLSDFPEGWDAEYRVTSFSYDEITGTNIIGLNADITNISPFPESGLLTYTQANRVFNSLGEYTVKEQLFNFRKPWYKYNGTLLKINSFDRIITNLSSFYFDDPAYNNSNIMLFGSISIDYRNEAIDFTLWAMFEQLIDPWCDFSNFEDSTIYNFTYIYDIKQ